jgi:F-box and leucine-rich repeat protein 7
MRRNKQKGGGSTLAGSRGNGPVVPDPLSLIRTFNSETNPSRPVRPSPLTASPINGMPLDILDRLRSFPLFQAAPEAFLTAIASHLRPQLHEKRDYILTEGDGAKAMYWLVRGAVAVTSRDGESTYAELRPGAFFGEIGILMEIPRTATIIAQMRSLLVVLTKEDLRKVLPKFPEVEQAIRDEALERLTILKKKKSEDSKGTATNGAAALPRPAGLTGGKRSREGTTGEVTMGDMGSISEEHGVISKKRKSPSPVGVDNGFTSSALGSGLVNVRQLLRELPLFSKLPSDILHFLGLSAQPMTFAPFADIFRQGSHGKEIYFIVRGEVEVVHEESPPVTNGTGPSNGRKRSIDQGGTRIKARLKQGQYFGEVASLSLAPRRTATVRSVGATECLMISGDVLNQLWKKCPADVREQVEQTARDRLDKEEDGDTMMKDAPVYNKEPFFDDLAIADRPVPKTPTKPPPIRVTFNHQKPESPHKPTRIEDMEIIEPFDPDPFLGIDFDNHRSKSRRGSLAPPPPDGASYGSTEASNNSSTIVPRPSSSATRIKHVRSLSGPNRKRVKTLERRPSQIGKGRLPDKLLVDVFRHLSLAEMMRLRLVCTHWCKILSSSPQVLPSLDLRKYNRKVNDAVLINSILPFVGGRPILVDISNCFHITDEGFNALASTCGPNVKTWKMKSVWDVTGAAVLDMASKARGLEEIDLGNCRKVSDPLLARVVGWVVPEAPFLPPQQNQASNGQVSPTKSRSHSNGAHTPQHPPPGTVIGCPRLKVLTLSYCKHISDRTMAHLAAHAASRLESVDLTRCTTITDQGFQQWSMYQFTNLKKLTLADCTYLTDNAVVYLTNAAKGLRELDLVSKILLQMKERVLIKPIELLLCSLRYSHRSSVPRLPIATSAEALLLWLRSFRLFLTLYRSTSSRPSRALCTWVCKSHWHGRGSCGGRLHSVRSVRCLTM